MNWEVEVEVEDHEQIELFPLTFSLDRGLIGHKPYLQLSTFTGMNRDFTRNLYERDGGDILAKYIFTEVPLKTFHASYMYLSLPEQRGFSIVDPSTQIHIYLKQSSPS